MEHFILSAALFLATLGLFALKARTLSLQPVRIKKNQRH